MIVTNGTLNATAFAQTFQSLAVGSSGALNLALGNLLTSTGTASFAGALNISGFASAGNYPLITYTSRTGTFVTVTGVQLQLRTVLQHQRHRIGCTAQGATRHDDGDSRFARP